MLGSRGVSRAAFANRAVAVPNDLDEIIKAIQLVQLEHATACPAVLHSLVAICYATDQHH